MDKSVIDRMVQLGTVTAVDPGNNRVRVLFPETGMTSDWLQVLRCPPHVAGTDGSPLNVEGWFPNINDTVVVLYIPVRDSDGYVIGGI